MDSAASFTAASPVFYVAFASSAGCTAASISAVCSSNPVFSAASYSAPSTLATWSTEAISTRSGSPTLDASGPVVYAFLFSPASAPDLGYAFAGSQSRTAAGRSTFVSTF